MSYTTTNSCRSCACTKLTYLFSLGDQFVSDFVPKGGIFSGPKVPIELVLCESCGLVQQLHSAPADMLYRRHYWYRCIGAREKIFARVKNWGKYKDRDCLVHDTTERIFSSPYHVELPCVELDGSVEWRPVLHREASVREVYEIEFFTGARVTASAEHRWPSVRSDMTWVGEKTTTELRSKTRVPVVMDMPRPDAAVDHESIYDEDAGYLVGVFLAEGCTGRRGIRLAVHRTNDGPMVERLREYVTGRLYESFRTGREIRDSKGMEISIVGPVVQGIIKKFVAGKLSKGKRLATAAWSQPTAFLKGVLDGWLDGDAHQEPDSDRSRFNICKNTDLVEDMALACRIVGYTMRYRERKGSGFRGIGDTTQYCGWVRKSRTGMRQKNGLGRLMGTLVNRVWKKPQPKKVWDVAVGGSQLYALGCGIVTHNSGITETMKASLGDVVKAACALVKPVVGDVVLDIGSNDGTLLRWYDLYAKGLVKVGVEPAENMRTYYKGTGEPYLIPEFWSADAYLRFMAGIGRGIRVDDAKAKIITALGMLYDIENPNPFIADVAKVLHPEGVFIAQLMCLKQMLQLGDVGNLCHEHLEFYSYASLRDLFERHGLTIFDVEENSVNGGSYRVYAKHGHVYRLNSHNTVAEEKAEQVMNLTDPATYSSFFQEAVRNRDECVRWLSVQYVLGKRIHVYGASTKGNVLLQWYGLAGNLLADKVADDILPIIDCAADKSVEKHGLYTVGSGIPIVSEEESRRMKPDIYLVLPYAFKSEFIEREKNFLARGGRLVFPLPRFEVVE